MRAHSLRFRLLCLTAATIVVTLTIAALALVTIFNRHLERRVEQELAVRLTELASGFALEDGVPAITRPLADPRYDQPYSGAYWQVLDESGPVLRSESLWDQNLALGGEAGPTPPPYEADGPRGSTLYVLTRQVKFTAGAAPRAFRLMVALDHADLEALGASFLGDVSQALAVIGGVLILGAGVQIQLGLRPLRRLHEQLQRIQQGRAARLRGDFPAEIAPLADSLNDLIDRQEDSVRKARQRAGDLAHGLKTPLTILAGEATRLEQSGNRAAAETLREQIGQMRAHVDRQLARARSHGASAAGGACTDVTATIERLFGLMRRMPRSPNLRWVSQLPPHLNMRMDPDDFGEVVGNLLDNARLWAAGCICVSARVEAERVTLCIDDDGPGVAEELRDQMAQRGQSGAAPGEGSGLGLAIVNDVLGLYGQSLAIDKAPLGGCRAAFAMPGWVGAPAAPDLLAGPLGLFRRTA